MTGLRTVTILTITQVLSSIDSRMTGVATGIRVFGDTGKNAPHVRRKCGKWQNHENPIQFLTTAYVESRKACPFPRSLTAILSRTCHPG